MSNRGPLAVASIETVDVEAPGAPHITLVQTSNRTIEATITAPVVDADGSPLSGLSRIIVGTALATSDGESPFGESGTLEQDSAATVVIEIDPQTDDYFVELPVLSPGALQFVAACAED